MERKFLTLFGAALLATAANAQTQAGAQAGAQADANVSTKPASANANASASSSSAAQTNGSNATIADGTAINPAQSAPVESKKATAGGAVGTVANTAGSATSAAGGAVDATARTTTGVAGSAGGAVGGLNSAGQFASNNRGVFGLNGLNLSAAGSNSTEGSLITSGG